MIDGARLVLLGGGGHAKVVLALATAAGMAVDAVCDRRLAAQDLVSWRGLAVCGDDVELARMPPDSVQLINGVGQVSGSLARARLYAHFHGLGFAFPVLVHPAAWVAPGVKLAAGVQVMAGAVLQPDVVIGENSIINTRASVDHDCVVGFDVHVAPGAVLCGAVTVEDGAFVGAGAIVGPGVRIGQGAVVGAGAVLLRDLAPGLVWRASLGDMGVARP